MYNFLKMLVLLVLAAVALGGEYGGHHGGFGGNSGGGSGGVGHGHGHATSSQNYVLHSYHPVPVYVKKEHHHHH